MEKGREYNKSVTTVHGTGVTNTGSPTMVGAEMITFSAESAPQDPHILGEEDSIRTMTGPHMGQYAAGSGSHQQRWGHVAQSGSQITVNDSPGGEVINIVHASGAGVRMEADGSVFLASASRRGMGLGAPRGDVFITAGGEIVIDGPGSVTLKSAGDLSIVVGGTLNIVAGAIKTSTKILEENIDGYATRAVTNDQSTTIGGINRTTIAGDQRTQVAGTNITDVGGDNNTKIDGKNDFNVSGDNLVKVKGESKNHSQGNMSHVTDADLSVESGATAKIVSGGNMTAATGGTLTVGAAGSAQIGSDGAMTVSSKSNMRVSGTSAKVSSTGLTEISGATATVGGSTVNLATATVQGPTPAGSGGSVVSFRDNTPDVADPNAATAPTAAEYPEPNDVVDSLTTVRKYPEYESNGNRESANATSVKMVSHDQSPGAEEVYDNVTSGNHGNQYPLEPGGDIDTLPEQPVNRDANIAATDPSMPTPSRGDKSAKISRYFTLGQLTNAPLSAMIPQSSWESVVQAHILLAYNVLDPIKEKFPDIIITNAYRTNSRNHRTGRAVDIVVPSRSLTAHAEIARFARDTLPVDQVFLERNTSGRTHVHLRVSESGQKTTPTVLTCSDPNCYGNTPGIAVEWLQRRM